MTDAVEKFLEAIAAFEGKEPEPVFKTARRNKREHFEGPAPSYDAFEYLKNWIGLGCWDAVNRHIRGQECTVCFAEYASEFGVTEYLVEVWYDHLYGQGRWAENHEGMLAKHLRDAYLSGYKAGEEAEVKFKATGEITVLKYSGPSVCLGEFAQGITDQESGAPNKYRAQ